MSNHRIGHRPHHTAEDPADDPPVRGARHPGVAGAHLPAERGRATAGEGRRTTSGLVEPQRCAVGAGDGGHGQEIQGIRLRQFRDAGVRKRQPARRRCPPLLRQHHQATASRSRAHPARAGLLGRSAHGAGRAKRRRQSGLRPTQPRRQPGHHPGGGVDQGRPGHRGPDTRAKGRDDLRDRPVGVGVGHAPQWRQHAGQDHHGEHAGDLHHAASGVPLGPDRGAPADHGLHRIDRGQRNCRVSRLPPAHRALHFRR